jgi:hypothetical protein
MHKRTHREPGKRWSATRAGAWRSSLRMLNVQKQTHYEQLNGVGLGHANLHKRTHRMRSPGRFIQSEKSENKAIKCRRIKEFSNYA